MQLRKRELLDRIKGAIAESANVPLIVSEIPDDASLFEHCGIDSLSLVKLVLSLEREFDITIADDELTTTAFESPEALASLVLSKLSSDVAFSGPGAGAA